MRTNIRNILISFIFLSSVSSLTNAQYLKESKLQNEISFFADTTKKKILLNEKSPFLAGSLSFFIPGLAFGQLYNEQPEKFFIHVCVTGASILGAILGIANFRFNFGGSTSNDGNTTIGPVIFLISAAVFAGNWLWSTIDAFHVATMNNRELERQRKTGYRNIRLQLTPGIGKNNEPNFNISVCF